MRMPVLLTSLLLLMCGSAVAAGTVAFNVKSYSTQQFPFVDEGYPVTGGVVIADFNRDGILDVAYSWPCCDASTSQGEIIVKMGTGGGNLGPDITYGFGAGDLSDLVAADVNGDGWLDILARSIPRLDIRTAQQW